VVSAGDNYGRRERAFTFDTGDACAVTTRAGTSMWSTTISVYVDGRPPPEAVTLDENLMTCPRCREDLPAFKAKLRKKITQLELWVPGSRRVVGHRRDVSPELRDIGAQAGSHRVQIGDRELAGGQGVQPISPEGEALGDQRGGELPILASQRE
jgi:hypothetical protein